MCGPVRTRIRAYTRQSPPATPKVGAQPQIGSMAASGTVATTFPITPKNPEKEVSSGYRGPGNQAEISRRTLM